MTRRSAWSVLVVLGTVAGTGAATASCEALVGAGDYQVGDADASGALDATHATDDATTIDSASVDSAILDGRTGADAGLDATGAVDTGSARDSATIADTGAPDARAADTGTPDTGASGDSGANADSGVAVQDSGPPDTGADSGSAATCSASFLNSRACTKCVNQSCAAQLAACNADGTCAALCGNCLEACDNTTCVDTCRQRFAGGVAAFDDLVACVNGMCDETTCGVSSVGDPCPTAVNTCDLGLDCNSAWCTTTCTRAADCTGLGAFFTLLGDSNVFGQTNACVAATSGGATCSPGCAGAADCAAFPGSSCTLTTSVDGQSVQVCAF